MSLSFARGVSLLGIWALVSACVEHDPKLERVGGTPGVGASGGAGGGAAGSAGASGAGGQAGAAGGCFPSLANPTLPCDVEAALKAKCQRCHGEPTVNGAPFPLLTWADTQADYFDKPIHERMASVVDSNFMPATFLILNPPVEELTPAEKTTLLDWLACPKPEDGVVCP